MHTWVNIGSFHIRCCFNGRYRYVPTCMFYRAHCVLLYWCLSSYLFFICKNVSIYCKFYLSRCAAIVHIVLFVHFNAIIFLFRCVTVSFSKIISLSQRQKHVPCIDVTRAFRSYNIIFIINMYFNVMILQLYSNFFVLFIQIVYASMFVIAFTISFFFIYMTCSSNTKAISIKMSLWTIVVFRKLYRFKLMYLNQMIFLEILTRLKKMLRWGWSCFITILFTHWSTEYVQKQPHDWHHRTHHFSFYRFGFLVGFQLDLGCSFHQNF